jgi:UDP-N-acetylmuramate: L-alanyl-gamma-D-glutamyl-meso-diaminopimelate ligase
MHYHFIAIGGSAMHNLAIALHKSGAIVTGSDDEIFDPAKSRLNSYGLLPNEIGWFPEKLYPKPDAIILGMHAKKDNPELLEAGRLGIRIFSYPEFLYEAFKMKKRVVIGGSHGKTTITSMILHIIKQSGLNADYMVGAQLEGFDEMVSIHDDSYPVAIIEGDEYLTSPIDLRPKFHLYAPHIAVISGIAWDHINVFPTVEKYLEQFVIFIQKIEPGGLLIYNSDDPQVLEAVRLAERTDITLIPYSMAPHSVENGITRLELPTMPPVNLRIFGKHNLSNLMAAPDSSKDKGLGYLASTLASPVSSAEAALRPLSSS